MGVKLKDIIKPETINFRDLDGKTIAIDAFNTLYQFLSIIRQKDGTPLMDENGEITSHLSGILYRNSSIMENGIKPIYIFDGQSPELKLETQQERKEIREESEKKWNEALAQGDEAEARKFAMRSSQLSPYIIESSKKLLNMMGIPYVEAYSEGESQAAYMVQKGDAWAVGSQDYDCLLFGADRMVRNLAIKSNLGNPEMFQLKKVLSNLQITREELIKMSIIIGTDFDPGLKRVGAKTALKYAKKGLLNEKIKLIDNYEKIEDIFLNPSINKKYSLKWNKANKKDIINFLCDKHGFSENRVSNAVDKIKNPTSSQKSLEDWF